MEKVIDDFAPAAALKGLRFSSNIKAITEVAIMCDCVQLEQVLSNLLSNALKYTPEQGEVVIAAQVQDGEVAISIKDTGIGIDEEDLSHLFERFYRARNATTRRVEGSGLGLSIAKSIVEQHEGHITVESVVKEGSTFTVYLPLNTPEE